MLKTILLTTALVGFASAANATLQIEVFDNGTLIDNITGVTTGAASLTANDATAAVGFTGAHELTIDVLQSAITGLGNTLSTFTVNGLTNDPGPTTESTFANGGLLATHTFPAALLDGSFGPVSSATGPFTSDETQFAVDFTAPRQSFGGSIQLTTNVPEPSTWAMLVAGFGLLAFMGYKRNRTARYAV
jgi:hypothetical protein